MSQKKFRDEYGLFVVEGDKMVEEALRSDFEVVEVYRRDKIGPAAMARISALSSPAPSLAVVRMPEEYTKTLDDTSDGVDRHAITPAGGLVLGLDSLRDPGNLGTIIRVADWFGIRDVYASRDTVELFNPKTVQATMGSVFRVRIHYCELASAARAVTACGGRVYGTFLDGEDIYAHQFRRDAADADVVESPVMIVVGNEANGISAEVAAAVTGRLFIPSFGSPHCESLNAAAATAIVISEYRRQTVY